MVWYDGMVLGVSGVGVALFVELVHDYGAEPTPRTACTNTTGRTENVDRASAVSLLVMPTAARDWTPPAGQPPIASYSRAVSRHRAARRVAAEAADEGDAAESWCALGVT